MRVLVVVVVSLALLSLAACESEDRSTVQASSASEPSEPPSCESIEDFAEAIVDVGITYDHQPSASPSSLASRSDVVFSGHLTGGFAHREAERDEPVMSWVAFEVMVEQVAHGRLALGEQVFVGVAHDPADRRAEQYEGLLPVGAPVVVFARELADPPATHFVDVEGFATACGNGPPLGRWGETAAWREVQTLTQLLEAANQPADRVEVTLWHCGIEPVTVDDRRWEVPREERPFDGTNAPSSFIGKGVIERMGPEELRYVDDSGVVLRFVPDDGQEPPCA